MRQSIKLGKKFSKTHIIMTQREITLPLSSWKKKSPSFHHSGLNIATCLNFRSCTLFTACGNKGLPMHAEWLICSSCTFSSEPESTENLIPLLILWTNRA